jgi:hypothetical protein
VQALNTAAVRLRLLPHRLLHLTRAHACRKTQYQYEPAAGSRTTLFDPLFGEYYGCGAASQRYVQVQCGGYQSLPPPGPPVGRPALRASPGYCHSCKWLISVVDTDDEKTVKATLSEVIQVETTVNKSIITANWRKNW